LHRRRCRKGQGGHQAEAGGRGKGGQAREAPFLCPGRRRDGAVGVATRSRRRCGRESAASAAEGEQYGGDPLRVQLGRHRVGSGGKRRGEGGSLRRRSSAKSGRRGEHRGRQRVPSSGECGSEGGGVRGGGGAGRGGGRDGDGSGSRASAAGDEHCHAARPKDCGGRSISVKDRSRTTGGINIDTAAPAPAPAGLDGAAFAGGRGKRVGVQLQQRCYRRCDRRAELHRVDAARPSPDPAGTPAKLAAGGIGASREGTRIFYCVKPRGGATNKPLCCC
ncbi:unnamed protein product, partial [Ectocarpus sp. 8 AP-2014]